MKREMGTAGSDYDNSFLWKRMAISTGGEELQKSADESEEDCAAVLAGTMAMNIEMI